MDEIINWCMQVSLLQQDLLSTRSRAEEAEKASRQPISELAQLVTECCRLKQQNAELLVRSLNADSQIRQAQAVTCCLEAEKSELQARLDSTAAADASLRKRRAH